MSKEISAKKAKSAGQKHYFTGRPCVNGRIAPRRVSDRHCTCEMCSSEKTKVSRIRKSATYQANAAHFKQVSKQWSLSNPDRNRDSKRSWREGNRDLRRVYDHRRRHRLSMATPIWFGEFDELLVQEAAHLCCQRESATGFPWHIDHMIPIKAKSACGLHCASNIQVIPASMNVRKQNKLTLHARGEWIGEL